MRVDDNVTLVPYKKAEAADIALAKDMADLLQRHYPNHLWAVNVNSDGGVADIKAINISSIYGYRLFLSKVYQDPTLRCVIKAGGEILERAHKARKGNDLQAPTILEGAAEKHQPFKGIVI